MTKDIEQDPKSGPIEIPDAISISNVGLQVVAEAKKVTGALIRNARPRLSVTRVAYL